MALTYAQSAALMTDATFVPRVKVAVLSYAGSILAEAQTTVQHNARRRWALLANASPDQFSAQIAQPVVMDPQVQTDGSAITDANLQASVQAVINNSFI
jgi:uncharacterized membrane protein affecting hemolysin expression